MKRKRLKRELRSLAEKHRQLEQAHNRLARHVEVIAVAVRSSEVVPESDLDDAILGIHELTSTFAFESPQRRAPTAA